jgi:Fe-S oxidoreductase
LENVQGQKYTNGCPSIARYNYHAYSGGGRMGIGMALVENELTYDSEGLGDIIYNCQMCGSCDVSCKYAMDMDVLEPMIEMRAEFQKKTGKAPEALKKIVKTMTETGKMVPAPSGATWYAGLNVADYTEKNAAVIFHAGCRTIATQSMWKTAQDAVKLLQKGGVEVAIAKNELCCGGRAFAFGFPEEARKQAEANVARFKKAGVKTIVTGCAECYQAFKVMYDRFNLKGDIEVLHTSEYFAKLIKEGKLKPQKAVNKRVTYQDPCNLGRLGEAYIHWEGVQKPGHIRLFDPPKEFRRGTYGVYEAPREVLKAIPGLNFTEMRRTREFAWCCGAGGGVKQSNPEFAEWTANERLDEAQYTGADYLVTACPGCEKNFNDALKNSPKALKVVDLTELLSESIL